MALIGLIPVTFGYFGSNIVGRILRERDSTVIKLVRWTNSLHEFSVSKEQDAELRLLVRELNQIYGSQIMLRVLIVVQAFSALLLLGSTILGLAGANELGILLSMVFGLVGLAVVVVILVRLINLGLKCVVNETEGRW